MKDTTNCTCKFHQHGGPSDMCCENYNGNVDDNDIPYDDEVVMFPPVFVHDLSDWDAYRGADEKAETASAQLEIVECHGDE